MSVNEKMTALANGVREISGTTSKKGIEAMTSDVNNANTEISEQTDLIDQIVDAVNNLPEAGSGGSSGGGGSAVETATVSYSSSILDEPNIHYLNSNLQHSTIVVSPLMGTTQGTISVVKNSIITTTAKMPTESGNITYIGGGYGTYSYIVTGDCSLKWSM